jgi:hypothetical protein
MKLPRHLAVFLALAAAATLAAQPPPHAERIVAPYVDVNMLSVEPARLRAEAGTRHLTLAFLTAHGGCRAQWPDATADAEREIAGFVERWRKEGGDVIVAFGGLHGREPAQGCPSAEALETVYEKVLERYHPAALDFDIEHQALDDRASVERRSRALAALERKHPGVRIMFTLPATPEGLTDKGLRVLASAQAHGVRVELVNLMAMDYGLSAPTKAMGANAIATAEDAGAQLEKMGLETKLGITPMIGMNDVAGETFTLRDAAELVAWARQHPAVALLSYWSLGRDNGGCRGKVQAVCSGIAQEAWQFAKAFEAFR